MQTRKFIALAVACLAVLIGLGIWGSLRFAHRNVPVAQPRPAQTLGDALTQGGDTDCPFALSQRSVKVKYGQSMPEVVIGEYGKQAEMTLPLPSDVAERIRKSDSAEGAWLRDTMSASWQEMLSSYDPESRKVVEQMNVESGDRIRQDKDRGAGVQIPYRIRFLYRVRYVDGGKEYIFIKTKEGPVDVPATRERPVLDEFVTVFTREGSEWVRTLTMRAHPVFYEMWRLGAADWREGRGIGQLNPPPVTP